MKQSSKAAIALSALVVVAGLAFGVYVSSAAIKAVSVKPTAPVVSKYEQGPPDPTEMLDLVNQERIKAGIAPLSFDETMQIDAQWKTDDMSARHYFAHKLPGTTQDLDDAHMQLASVNCKLISENLTSGPDTSAAAVKAWMASKLHREAILDARSTTTGFGVTKTSEGTYLSGEHFCIAK
jgi:uncharacterized protein YkwD